LEAGRAYRRFVLLDSHRSNHQPAGDAHARYDFIAALGAVDEVNATAHRGFEQLRLFSESRDDWLFGYFTYDLKNEVEQLSSSHPDEVGFPALHFFQPLWVVLCTGEDIRLEYLPDRVSGEEVADFAEHLMQIDGEALTDRDIGRVGALRGRFTEDEYLAAVNQLKSHIQRGDVYEVTFCQEYFAQARVDPFVGYHQLGELSPAPFSCFYRLDHRYLLSASPERFLSKVGNHLISQPIKGTIGRGSTPEQDRQHRGRLARDIKEQAENVMIVDLVRNDLSRTALPQTVKVDELFGIYAFPQVYQMISTVSARIDPRHYLRSIRQAFPMGSMTGAPKVRAMELIEQYERSRRGLYSGAVGYFSPDKDFDFNVVIRSLLYNAEKNYVSFQVGGAITSLSDPRQEYEECQVKAKALKQVLTQKKI